MRAIVLLLLAGSVLWIVLGIESVEEPSGPAREVVFLDADADLPEPPTGAPSSGAALEPAATKRAEAGAETPVPATPPSPLTAEAELELASELVHRPASVESFLASRPILAPGPRRELVLALARAISDDPGSASRGGAAVWDDPGAGSTAERGLLRRLAEHGTDHVPPVYSDTALARAASMGRLALEGRRALGRGEHVRAAESFSELLAAELQAPWPADGRSLRTWSAELRQAQLGHQWNRKGGWPSIEVTVEKGDSLISIRKRVLAEHPELLISTGLIERANELRGDAIQPGQLLRIPTSRPHALVDVDAHWVLYYLGDLVADAWEVGVGKQGSETPPGTYTVRDKNIDPMWFPPGRQPVPFGDPENPLGTRWIGWVDSAGRNSGLAFHGTKDPDSIGQDQSQGCVRMRNSDVEQLFEILPMGATVVVQP